jgi:uncharacterized protein (DUF2147 family)
MKFYNTLFAIFISSFVTFAQSAKSIVGVWLSETKESKIEIYQQGNEFFGKIVWAKTEGIKDIKNPDPKLKNRPLLGLVLLTNFKSTGSNTWNDGKIYDPLSGKTYNCTMNLVDGKLKIRGYIGISLFGRTTIWTKSEVK